MTLVLPVRARHRAERRADDGVRRATDADLAGIAAFLQAELARYQFAPCWSEDDLRSPERRRDLTARDFRVYERGGRVEGVAALWDQGAFKQTIVRGYSGALALARPLANALAPLLGIPPLLAVGQPLRHAYVSHLATRGDDPDAALALIARILADARAADLGALTLALARRHPLLPPIRRAFRCLEYRSVLHLVHWDDGADAVAALSDRVPYLELATL